MRLAPSVPMNQAAMERGLAPAAKRAAIQAALM